MIFLDALIAGVRRLVEFIAKVDNTQAVTAVRRGYSKKLKFPERTHKCSVGSVHEFIESGQLCIDYAPTLTRRGDGCTKCLTLAKLIEARKMMSMIST